MEVKRGQIAVAAITVLGGLATAVIANWDKLFPKERSSSHWLKPTPKPLDSANPEKEETDAALTARARATLQDYYLALKKNGSNLARFFAPVVERYMALENTTPFDIQAYFSGDHPRIYEEYNAKFLSNTLQLVDRNQRKLMYEELVVSRLRGKDERVTSRVLVDVRFDKNMRIVYLRQPRILEKKSVKIASPKTAVP